MIPNNLIQEKHSFYEQYEDHKGEMQSVCVYLDIDYRTREFKVLPGDGRAEFGFVTGSHKYAMWQATVKCMQAAMNFAVKVLHYNESVTVKKKSEAVTVNAGGINRKLFALLPKRARRGIIEASSSKLGKKITSSEELSLELLAKLSYKDMSNVRWVGVDTMHHIVLFFQKHGLNVK